jgi:hypothetical protein
VSQSQNERKRHLPREDVLPWYRQFWPWFLIALPGTVVVAALSTLVIANRYADDLVVDDYYKTGLAINQELEKQRAAAARGLEAQLRVFERHIQLRLAGGSPEPELRLALSHPLEADRDFTVTLRSSAPGLYLAELPAVVAPRWHWTLSPAGEAAWRIDGSLERGDFLSPAGP